MNGIKLMKLGVVVFGAAALCACGGASRDESPAESEDAISIKQIDYVAESLGLGKIDWSRSRGDDKLKAHGTCYDWYMRQEIDGDPNDGNTINNFRRYTGGAVFFANRGSDTRRIKCVDIDVMIEGEYFETVPLAGAALDAAVRFDLGRLVFSDAAMGGQHGYTFEKTEGGRTVRSMIGLWDPAHHCGHIDFAVISQETDAYPELEAGHSEYRTCMSERRGDAKCAQSAIAMCQLTARRELAKAAARNNPNLPASIDGIVQSIQTEAVVDGVPHQAVVIPESVAALAALHDAAGFGQFIDIKTNDETEYFFFENKNGGEAAIGYSIHPRGRAELLETYLHVDREAPWTTPIRNACTREVDDENHTATPWKCSSVRSGR